MCSLNAKNAEGQRNGGRRERERERERERGARAVMDIFQRHTMDFCAAYSALLCSALLGSEDERRRCSGGSVGTGRTGEPTKERTGDLRGQ